MRGRGKREGQWATMEGGERQHGMREIYRKSKKDSGLSFYVQTLKKMLRSSKGTNSYLMRAQLRSASLLILCQVLELLGV